MNKKIFGLRIGTVLSVLVSLIVAIIFWLFVKFTESDIEMVNQAYNSILGTIL